MLLDSRLQFIFARRQINVSCKLAIEGTDFFAGACINDVDIAHILFFKVIVFHNNGHTIFLVRTLPLSTIIELSRIVCFAQRKRFVIQRTACAYRNALDFLKQSNRNRGGSVAGKVYRVANVTLMDFIRVLVFQRSFQILGGQLRSCHTSGFCICAYRNDRTQNFDFRAEIQTNGQRAFQSTRNNNFRCLRGIGKLSVFKLCTNRSLNRKVHMCLHFRYRFQRRSQLNIKTRHRCCSQIAQHKVHL